MSESTGPGMGRPSGPDFAGPPVPGAGSPSAGSGWSPRQPSAEPPPSAPRPPRPPRSRLPAVLTAMAIAVVGLVVVLASVWAVHQDARQAAAPQPVPSPPATASPSPARQIEFTSDTGSGVLRIVRHSWDPAGSTADGKSLLTLEIAVSCTSGTLRYGPDSFEAFDQHGGLFESTYDPDSSTALELIRLSAGEEVSGTVTFEIPRGEVTLLLSDDLSRPVTALKVPD